MKVRHEILENSEMTWNFQPKGATQYQRQQNFFQLFNFWLQVLFNILWLLWQEFHGLHSGVQSEIAKEQRKVRADNIDFGQHPENNQILDGDETCKVLIAANFFILMFWISLIVWKCCLFWFYLFMLINFFIFLNLNQIVRISLPCTDPPVFTVISRTMLEHNCF